MSTASSAVFRRFFLPPSTLRLVSRPLRILESKSPKNKLSILWVVPWAAGTILQVVFYWATTFWLIGSLTVRCAAHRYGCIFTYEGKARLVIVVTQAIAGIIMFWLCLSQCHELLPPGWFRFSLKGKWLLDVILGCLTFPLIPQLRRFNQNLITPPPPPRPSRRVRFPVVEESSRAKWLHVIKVSICAPLWEEIFFRGFLMASLTRYMPVWCAILVSSIVFAIAHLNSRVMLPIGFFGMVLGAIFSRSRNLFPPMLLHSLYNISVFLGLFIKEYSY